MESLFTLVDILICGFGFYALYSAFLLKTKNVVNRNILLSKDMLGKKCRDIEGYKNYMVKRIIIASVLMIILSGITVVNDFIHTLTAVTSWLFLPLLFCILWFAIFSSKGQKTYYE